MIEIQQPTKVYGDKTAVDDLTFTFRPGVVTGFPGPNGAGSSTTMRAILGVDRPTRGQALVAGRRYVDNPAPLCVVALLEAGAAQPGRSATNHLQSRCLTREVWTRPRTTPPATLGRCSPEPSGPLSQNPLPR